MKYKIYLTLFLFLVVQAVSFGQDQNNDTKIPFDKGVLKLCSSKNFKIKGYDGKEVIIKSLTKVVKNEFMRRARSTYGLARSSGFTVNNYKGVATITTDTIKFGYPNRVRVVGGRDTISSPTFPTFLGYFYNNESKQRGKGLQKLGKKATAEANGIYLNIEQIGNELIIKDDRNDLLFTVSNESYELLIPNTLKLQWDTNSCEKNKSYQSLVYYSKSSELSEFKGEVEISTSLKNLSLVDVSGPVSINTIGGNVTVEFLKSKPQFLYSIYSNNGFIDIRLPSSSSLSIDATAEEILSDLDFTIESEIESEGSQQMKLKLGKGKVKMNLNAGFGTIYLRKKE